MKNTIKRFRRGKYRKQLKNVKEIKAYKSDEKLIKDLLKNLNRMEIEVYSIYYNNKKDPLKNYSVNEIYQFLILELLKLSKLNNTPSNLFIDKFLPKTLEKKFTSNLRNFLKDNTSNVSCVHSENNTGIQFADLISWSTFQYLERKNEAYLKIIENKYILIEFNQKE
ncbi:hypothetical protein MARBORIA2_11560 [Methanobrevibacter arboriphilus]|uniref:Uncharacterized protein n=1 Tax=Methanobrevibacter arboriphilus TaxID=39441 RepID=A0ACA8R5I4_METAZ|nr:DUF3800 domain-containing protein [Methanobrevibacter arboriphilus]BBL62824.1 hypothetical protein MarbSA_18640 [Methanobrevibacter arboriphilus]GLI12066.1 hypothetical protein MARBORIA2_11560 [Methanobrevibacter arboriphilus]